MRRRYLANVMVVGLAVLWAAACVADTPAAKTLPPELAALYAYDKTAPLNLTTSEPKEAAKTVEERIESDSPKGGRVAGLLIRPKDVAKPWVILVLHGYGGSKNDARLFAMFLADKGYAVLGLDAALHGDRKVPGKDMFADPASTRDAMIQTVVDYRRAMDYLATRKDVRSEAFGLVGVSMGAIQGTIVSAVDQRVASPLLVVGGGDWSKFAASSTRPEAAAMRTMLQNPAVLAEAAKMDPLTFAPYISPRPAWFANGRQDNIIPVEAATALQEAAGEPKHIIWYDGGHLPPLPIIVQTMNQWLSQALQPALVKASAVQGAAGGAQQDACEGK